MTQIKFNLQIFGWLLIVFLIGGDCARVAAQTRKTRATTKKIAAPASQTKKSTAAAASGATLRSEKNAALSKAWESGELPVPLPVPAGDIDEVAAILARKVAAKNAESVPALLTALQLSGFFVTAKNGSTLLAPTDGKGQGLTINGWEVASAARMLGDNRQTNLKDLETSLQTIKPLKNFAAGAAILNGLRRNADNRQNQFLRVWARFVIELGKNSDTKYDIASGTQIESVTLDAVQNLMILRRLYGDVFALGEKYNTADRRRAMQNSRGGQVQFVRAGYSKNTDYFVAQSEFTLADEKQIPCKMDGDAPVVMDTVATVSGIGFGELTGFLEEALPTAGDAIGKYSKIVGIANIILSYAKFLQTYAALETTLTLEDGAPLVRTKNSTPGGRKNLRADVRFNIGNWQIYNCFRTAINLAGVDFATVNDGPAGGIGVTWHLDEGGGKDVYSNAGGLTGKEQIVGFTQGGGRIQDVGTSAGTRGANRVGNAVYTKTDGDGVGRIMLEGTPQKNAVIGKAMPVMKRAKVRTTVKVKAGDLKGESVDVAGQVLGGTTGLITMPLELLYRMDWASTASLVVPVQDWEECEGGWSGTVTVTKKSYKEQPNGSGSTIESEIYTANLQVSGKLDPEGGFNNRYLADANIEFRNRRLSKYQYEKDSGFCGRNGPYYEGSLTKTSEILKTANGASRAKVSIAASGSTGSLMIEIKDQIIGSPITQNEVYKGVCSVMNAANTKSKTGENYILNTTGFSVSFEIDPARPNELRGSKTVDEGNGKTTTYTWELRRCE